MFTKSGRYVGGIHAHVDIVFEFASWILPEFKLYIIKDYQCLKSDENSRLSLDWNLNREIAKLNYHIHTDANLNQILVLANMENYNAILIGQGKTVSERLVLLRELAVKQMKMLAMVSMDRLKQLPGGDSE